MDLNPKKGWEEVNFPPPLVIFSKLYIFREPWFFVTFNIIIIHICPENFIEIPQVVRKIWRFSSSVLTNFIIFFWIFL